MKTPDTPHDEQARLETLRSLGILGTAAEERFDRLTRMARRLFGVPIALVSLVDENRQWFKSSIGVSVSETPRDISFCGHAILGDDIFIIPDTSVDERFADNPLVTNDPHIGFYAVDARLGFGGVVIAFSSASQELKGQTFKQNYDSRSLEKSGGQVLH